MITQKYPENFLVQLGLKRQTCLECGRVFWHIKEDNLCGDQNCRGSFSKTETQQETLTDFTKKTIAFLAKNPNHQILQRSNSLCLRGSSNFMCAGISAFETLLKGNKLQLVKNKTLINLQFCYRFSDSKNVAVTGIHSTGFFMLGLHRFESPEGLFQNSWKENSIEEILNMLYFLGFDLSEIWLHQDYWSDGQNGGPSIEFFIKGLEVCNCVYMQQDVNLIPRPNKVLDVGIGIERLAKIKGIDVGLGNPLDSDLKVLLVALKDRASPSKIGIGYNLRKLLEKYFSQDWPKQTLLDKIDQIAEQLENILNQNFSQAKIIFNTIYDHEYQRYGK